MTTAVKIATRDLDLGRTIALWVADLLKGFLAAQPSATVGIDDDGLAGRPFRRGGARSGVGDFRAWRDERGAIRLTCSSSSVFLPPRRYAEGLRKLLVIAGATRDAASIDHFQVIRQQQRVRQRARSMLGSTEQAAPGQCLLRVDDFPSPFADSEEILRFHEVAVAHGLPYLLAVTPFFGPDGNRRPLSDREIQILHRCASEGATLALHGFSHRSRYRNYASELLSLPMATLRTERDQAVAYLRQHGLDVVGFVAPFNTYDPFTISALAERFPLLCGGPESVRLLGHRAGPSFLMQSLYVPSYRHAYDVDHQGLRRFDRLLGEAAGLVVPVTLHWANETREGLRSFRALCARMAGRTLRWTELLSRAEWVKALPAGPGQDG